MSYPERPHLQFPFQRSTDGTRINVVEQDTTEDVMSCELVIVHAPLGFRDDRPEFGWPWPELEGVPINIASLEQALHEFEPRGKADASQYYDVAQAAVIVNVNVKIEAED
jgi:hypothetical protein